MITVKKLNRSQIDSLPIIADDAFIGEIVTLKISRLSLSLNYSPLPNSFFMRFPPAVTPAQAFDSGGCVLEALEDGIPIGSCTLVPSSSGWLDIADIRINAGNRRHGGAALLISTAFTISRESKLSGLHIAATDSNPVLCQMCEHTGFKLGGFDRCMFAFTDDEKQRPMQLRTCGLHFYKWDE